MIDYSTLDQTALAKLEKYVARPTWHVDKHLGSGCYGDPPGFPSYFLQSVYTQYGNPPRTRGGMAPQELICGRVVFRENSAWNGKEARLRRLYKPLPEEHARVQAWEQAKYAHHARCYFHPTEMEGDRRKVVIWGLGDFTVKTFKDDPRFSDEWRQAEKASIEAHNSEIKRLWDEIAVPDNHSAVVLIREWYPEHTARLDWILDPPANPGNWWERWAERPTPMECPGDVSVGLKHTAKWCQFCGWTAKERLEYLRGEIHAERISYLELAELQGLAEFIEEGDVELLEWAGVPEFPEE